MHNPPNTCRRLLLLSLAFCAFASAVHARPEASRRKMSASAPDKATMVDPFIGTGGHGHTFPGASLPFGMVQLSPDTRIDGWDACSGYHAADRSIMGFSHTHLSGTGVADYGDILVMPSVGTHELEPGPLDNPDAGYRSRFRKKTEAASPGYYRVTLDDYRIEAELTATQRVGMHRYRFPASHEARILFDLRHRNNQNVTDSYAEVLSPTEVIGFRRSADWAADQHIYFYAEFSKPMGNHELFLHHISNPSKKRVQGSNVKLAAYFSVAENEEILVKVGLSAVSAEAARANLRAELDHWDFDQVRAEARATWNQELNKISIRSQQSEVLVKFYTSMYHAMLAPNLYMDADGTYRGSDRTTHQANDFVNYTVFSLWDTYRALHPLFTIIDQKRTNDFIRTLLRRYQESGLLPVWELSANETNTMIGYHAVPVIVDAFMKGIADYDVGLAYEAIKHSAEQDHYGLSYYKKIGYIPYDKEGESVSKTLEYSYDDWTIAQMAGRLGATTDEQLYRQRSLYYRNLFDTVSGLMRPKLLDGTWLSPFDPYNADHRTNGFTEANAMQYSWYIPHDVAHHQALLGGKAAYADKLDAFFNDETPLPPGSSPDISGMIGQYAHGNEPSHHIAYLYQLSGRPHATEELVRRIMDELYTASPDGLSGNEDCGQMSAWFIFSALGFYPLAPGDSTYVFGSPLVDSADIHLENGKVFHIRVHGQSPTSRRVARILLNGQPIRTTIRHEGIMAGGRLDFYML